jgi:signal transduction histidine kinase
MKILLAEDNPDDELLIVRALRRYGLEFECRRVDSRREFIEALDGAVWDTAIIDYSIPGFGGVEALEIAKEKAKQLPVIMISGTIGEERAVQLIKSGADDYLMKDNLARLGPAIHRAIREAQDRRERSIAEASLATNRQQLQLIVDHVSDMLLFLANQNGQWKIASFNHAFEQMGRRLGVRDDARDFIGMEISEFEKSVLQLDSESMEAFVTHRQQAIFHKTPFRLTREIPLRIGLAYMQINYIPVVNTDGSVENLLVDIRDMTAQWQAEKQARIDRDQLVQSQKLEAMGTLAGGIAHDFNNLLTGLFGFAELAKEATELSVIRGYCNEVIGVANQSRELIERILAFSRRSPAVRKPTRLCAIVQEMLPLVRIALPASVRLEVALPDPGPMLMVDSGQMGQVLLNLCTNAVHAMPNGGVLTIAVSGMEVASSSLSNSNGTSPIQERTELPPGYYARLAVTDTGSGMSPETIRRAFEPFFTTKPVGKGTGLGLSVAHGVITEHGGTIQIQSRLNHGTTVELLLPEVRVSASDSRSQPWSAFGKGSRILYVEDDKTLARMTTLMLTGLGFQPDTFVNAQDAYESLTKSPDQYVAVVTDNRMPDLSGAALAEKISMLRPEMPIVLVTANIDANEKSLFLSRPSKRILDKPYTLQQLANALASVMKDSD